MVSSAMLQFKETFVASFLFLVLAANLFLSARFFPIPMNTQQKAAYLARFV
jgi:hypothetical protein